MTLRFAYLAALIVLVASGALALHVDRVEPVKPLPRPVVVTFGA